MMEESSNSQSTEFRNSVQQCEVTAIAASLGASHFRLVDAESTIQLVATVENAYQHLIQVAAPLLPVAHTTMSGETSIEKAAVVSPTASTARSATDVVPQFIATPMRLHNVYCESLHNLPADQSRALLLGLINAARQSLLPAPKPAPRETDYNMAAAPPEVSPAVAASPFLGGFASGYNLRRHGSTRKRVTTVMTRTIEGDLGTVVSNGGDPFSGGSTPASAHDSPVPHIEEHDQLFRLHSEQVQDSDDEDGDGIGTTINGYMIVGELGTGSFGRVVLAIHNTTDDVVAIKIVKRSLLNKERRRAITAAAYLGSTTSASVAPPIQPLANQNSNIRREIAIMKKLRHKHLVALRAVVDDETADRMYLIMQYIPHGPFLPTLKGTNAVRVTQLSEKDARSYTRQLISALRYLHANNIVHRDVKPENILKGEQDRIYLADFGVSEIVDDLRISRSVKGTRGTPSFWSPELFDENETSVDGVLQDEWALSVTIYLMLVGRLPFEGRNIQDLSHSVRFDSVLIPDTLSADARDFLRRALSRNKSERLNLASMRAHPFVIGKASRPRRNLMAAQRAADRINAQRKSASPEDPTAAAPDLSSAIDTATVIRRPAPGESTTSPISTYGFPLVVEPSSPGLHDGSSPPDIAISQRPPDYPTYVVGASDPASGAASASSAAGIAPQQQASAHLKIDGRSSFRHLTAAFTTGQLLTPNSSRAAAKLVLGEARHGAPATAEEAWDQDSLSGDEDEEVCDASGDSVENPPEPTPPKSRRASQARPPLESLPRPAFDGSPTVAVPSPSPLQRVGSYSVSKAFAQQQQSARMFSTQPAGPARRE